MQPTDCDPLDNPCLLAAKAAPCGVAWRYSINPMFPLAEQALKTLGDFGPHCHGRAPARVKPGHDDKRCGHDDGIGGNMGVTKWRFRTPGCSSARDAASAKKPS
jgi:hypothetical protein